MKKICTHEGVIRKLGGPKKAAAATKRNTQAVFNWLARSRFPPVLYFVFEERLKERGAVPDRQLFHFEKP